MTAPELVRAIEAAGGILLLDGGEIECELPESAAALFDALAGQKQAVLEHLRGEVEHLQPVAHLVESWLWDRCRFSDRFWTLLTVLHRDFTATQGENEAVTLVDFEGCLRDAGFRFATYLEAVGVHGLALVNYIPPDLAERLNPRRFHERDRLVIDLAGDD